MIIGTNILWGNIPESELPKLPDGWRYKIEEGCWLIAISPKGEEYYCAADRLYARRKRPSGTYFVDTENGVIHL